jgi:hypothetical protein
MTTVQKKFEYGGERWTMDIPEDVLHPLFVVLHGQQTIVVQQLENEPFVEAWVTPHEDQDTLKQYDLYYATKLPQESLLDRIIATDKVLASLESVLRSKTVMMGWDGFNKELVEQYYMQTLHVWSVLNTYRQHIGAVQKALPPDIQK